MNSVLAVLKLDSFTPPDSVPQAPLHEILDALLDDAAGRGLIDGDSVTCRDMLDTAVMGALTPRRPR